MSAITPRCYLVSPSAIYYNEVHYKWFPVPPHWVGTDLRLLTDLVNNHPEQGLCKPDGLDEDGSDLVAHDPREGGWNN